MVACIDETGFHFLEPQPDEVLGIDSLFVFRWIPLSPGAVTLDVDRNYPSGEWELIAEHLSEDGEHPWIVTPPESDHARFRIRSEDNPQIADTTDGDIWIAHPRLALTYPDGGDTIWASNSDTIRFRRLLKYCSVSAQLNRDYPNGEWENVNAAGYGTDYLVWHVRGPSSFNCRMRIFDPSDTTVMDSSQEDFALLESHLRVLSPNGGEHVLGSSWQMIRWSFPHYTGNVEIMINFYYPANPWSYIVESMPNSGDYWWWVPPVPGGHCRIRVRALGNPEMMDTSDDNFSIVLATETVETPLLPTEFSLSAFPNPFNAISTLTLALPEATQLSLTLYDVNGRVVQSLASGVFTAGIHAVPVDGSPLPSGLYFVQLSSVRYSATHKLLLLK